MMPGYNSKDNENFEKLVSMIDVLDKPSQSAVAQSGQKADQNSIEYSLTDKQAFSRLMPEGFGENDGQAGDLEKFESVSETSHIKIIDFDKEQSRERSWASQEQSQIRIRYFD